VSTGLSKAILFQPPGRAPRDSRLALQPIANQPMVRHSIEMLAGAGMQQVMLVCSPEEVRELQDAVAPHSTPELSWLVHDEPCDLAASLRLASDFVAGDAFVVHLGDSLCREPLDALLQADGVGARGALALVEETGRAPRSVVPLHAHPLDGGDPAGVYALGAHALDAVLAAPPLGTIEEGLLATIGVLAARGGRVETRTVGSWWRHRGHADALLEANRFLLEGLTASATDATLEGCHIQGNVEIDGSAWLKSSTVRGPAVIGPGAHLINAYVGPYSSIGADVVIEGAEIENSIILPGASISHVGGRLEASIVGARARVFRDFRLPRANRLNVGDGAEVSLA
jgi:glucose-1-phosphate thymidylyltransferase